MTQTLYEHWGIHGQDTLPVFLSKHPKVELGDVRMLGADISSLEAQLELRKEEAKTAAEVKSEEARKEFSAIREEQAKRGIYFGCRSAGNILHLLEIGKCKEETLNRVKELRGLIVGRGPSFVSEERRLNRLKAFYGETVRSYEKTKHVPSLLLRPRQLVRKIASAYDGFLFSLTPA